MLNRVSNKQLRIIYIGITLLIFFFNFRREIINVNDGVGWDGMIYLQITKNPCDVKEKKIDQYHIQRILVPLVVNGILQITNSNKSIPEIIKAYRFFNFFCILLAIFYYIKISTKLSLSQQNELIGFCSIFWIFPILKLLFYYPMLTDYAAFTLGLIFVYYYLNNQLMAMLLILLLGSFVYPTFSVFLVLLVFKRDIIDIEEYQGKIQYLILPSLFLVAILGIYFLDKSKLFNAFFNTASVTKILFPFSLICATIYLFYTTNFLPRFRKLLFAFNELHIKNLIFCTIFYIVVVVVRKLLSSQSAVFTLKQFLLNIAKQSITNPLIFIVAHTIYFGLFFLLIFYFRKQLKEVIRSFGLGMTLWVFIIIFFSLGNESRQMLNFYPLIITILIIAIQKSGVNFSNLALSLYLIVSLFISSFWAKLSWDGELKDNFLTYPAQNYFRYQGPWMSNYNYAIFVSIFLLILTVFFILHKAKKLVVYK